MNEDDIQKAIAAHVALYQRAPEAGMKFDTRPLGGRGIVDTLLLITTGRVSGKTRTTPLIFGEQAQGYVVVASNGGRASHPSWYLNLGADPQCRIQVGHAHKSGVSRQLAGSDREAAWDMMVDIYPPYAEYQFAASRELPVLMIEPRD